MLRILTFIGSDALSGFKERKPLLGNWVLRRSGHDMLYIHYVALKPLGHEQKANYVSDILQDPLQYGDGAFDDESKEYKKSDTYFVFPRLGTIFPCSSKAAS